MRSRAKRGIAGLGLAALAAAGPLAAQEGGLAGRCPGAPAEAREFCLAVAQAAESAQPQVGVLIAGGNPTPGTTGGGGLRLGRLPRVDLTARANVVFIRLPDILAAEAGATAQRLNERLGIPAPALAVDGALGVFPGLNLAPGIGGIGAVDVLAGATWLPFRAVGLQGFEEQAPDLAWGVGARIGLLRESFVTPGVAVTVMRRRLGSVAFGDVCANEPGLPDGSTCVGPGDAGEFAFDLTDWSTRAVVGKRLLGLGLLAGVGYDRYASEVAYAFRWPTGVPEAGHVERPDPVDLRSARWSVFGNVSYTFLLASLSLEAGWQQGGSPVPGFGDEARFDPRGGSFFGGAGLRLAF